MNYLIEQREINALAPAVPPPSSVVVDAPDTERALQSFVSNQHCELLSYVNPAACSESIATVRQGDSVLVLRIYPE